MKTITDVKEDLVNHLFSIDKTKLNMVDLRMYCDIVKTVNDMSKPDPSDYLKDAMKAMSSGFGGNYKPVETKGD